MGFVVSIAAEDLEQEKVIVREQAFYVKIGSGASFAQKAHVYAPPAVWDPALQGYNSGLGTAPIILGGLGWDSPFVAADITAAYRPNFKYKKFQTPSTGGTPGQLGEKTRRFDLDISSIMLSTYFNGRGIRALNWKTGGYSSVYPFIGGGIGVSQLTVSNFRSTGLPSIVEPLASFGSENQYNKSYSFTYQLMTGLEYRYRDVCALSVGYRWFSINKFNGPEYIRTSTGDAFDAKNNTWRINFSANEALIEFKVFL